MFTHEVNDLTQIKHLPELAGGVMLICTVYVELVVIFVN